MDIKLLWNLVPEEGRSWVKNKLIIIVALLILVATLVFLFGYQTGFEHGVYTQLEICGPKEPLIIGNLSSFFE